jgi:hypothetical protein
MKTYYKNLVYIQKVVNRFDNLLEKKIIAIEKKLPQLTEKEINQIDKKL